MGFQRSLPEGEDVTGDGAASPRAPVWAGIVSRLYRVYFRTLRVQALLPDGSLIAPHQYPFDDVVFAHCERDTLLLGGMLTHIRFSVMVATGRDGNRAAGVLRILGADVVSGSSGFGGATALSRLIRRLRGTRLPAAISVDGPLGPAGVAKAGALMCAKQTARRVVPLGTAALRRFVFPKTWSGIYLPLPFSRAVIACGEPLWVPAEQNRHQIAALALHLTDLLGAERARAEHALSVDRRAEPARSPC